MSQALAPSVKISIRPLQQRDLPAAQSIFRIAFGTFLGLPDPHTLWPDRDTITVRWHADQHAAVAAEVDGQFAGSNFAANWGSVGFFGPLTIHPDFWDKGV